MTAVQDRPYFAPGQVQPAATLDLVEPHLLPRGSTRQVYQVEDESFPF
jgi:hypothetical protein